MRKLIAVSFVIMSIMACAPKYNITMTGYGGQNGYPDKTYDFALTSDMVTDLESMKYVGMLENKLACIGWKRNAVSHDYIISPSFGISGEKQVSGSGLSVGGGFGMLSGGVGTFLSTSIGPPDSTEYSYFMNIKLFLKGKTSQPPIWEGKITSSGKTVPIAEVMPVFIKYAVENFGKNTDGRKEFTFDASEENLKSLDVCPN
jgi:hypothetical protein